MTSQETLNYQPSHDGFDHINACSMGKTLLGRMLSNFDETHIDLPGYGHFASIEALWVWLKSKNDLVRTMSGHEAKAFGKKLPVIGLTSDSIEFQEIILSAVWLKIKTNKVLEKELLASTLPITHYYVRKDGYGDEFAVPLKEHAWLWKGIEVFRSHLKNGTIPKNFKEMTEKKYSENQFSLF